MTARILISLLLAAAVSGQGVRAARADGDPASDVLYVQDVFVTYTAPSPDLVTALTGEVAKANTAGYRIKVAVIASAIDLGSVPALFDQPQLYAQFLGTELSSFYTNRLLVVMPNGFGIYNNGAGTDAEASVLRGLQIEGADPDSLTRAATEAVQNLAAAAKPTPPKDHAPPTVKAFPASGQRGQIAKLRYSVSDDSGKSRETIRVYGEQRVLYTTLVTNLRPAPPGNRPSGNLEVSEDSQDVGSQILRPRPRSNRQPEPNRLRPDSDSPALAEVVKRA
jgi:hypothetical protein